VFIAGLGVYSGAPPAKRIKQLTNTALNLLTRIRGQTTILLTSLGHSGTHWSAATFYLLVPFIAKDLGLTYSEAGLFVALFHSGALVANFSSGLLTDITGRRVLFQFISLAVGATALMMFGFTKHYVVLCTMVVLIGATNNLWHPPAISYLSSHYPKSRGYALAIHGLGANLGDAIGPLAAGFLLLSFTWQGTAVANSIPIFIIAAILLIYLLPRDGPNADGGPRGMGLRDYFIGMWFVVKERAVLGLCLMTGLRAMAQTGLLAFLPLYLANVMEIGPLWMGVTLMGMQVGGMIATPVAGILSDRIGRRSVVVAGLSSTTILIVVLTFVTNDVAYIVGVSVLGLSLYAVRPVVQSWMLDLTPERLGGSATSLMFGMQSGLSIIMPVIGGVIADAYGLKMVFYFIAAAMLAANIVAMTLTKDAQTANVPAA
jgi:MFS family permease